MILKGIKEHTDAPIWWKFAGTAVNSFKEFEFCLLEHKHCKKLVKNIAKPNILGVAAGPQKRRVN